MPVDGVKVEGLNEFRKALKAADVGLAKDLSAAGKSAADIVAREAQSRIPVLTGKARASVRSVVSQGGGGVRAGGAKAPHYAWLDFGGRVGRNKSVARDRIRGGRYIYPAIADKADAVVEQYEQAVADLLRKVGLT